MRRRRPRTALLLALVSAASVAGIAAIPGGGIFRDVTRGSGIDFRIAARTFNHSAGAVSEPGPRAHTRSN